MSRGMTIAEFVQQVFYAVYKVRLDVDASLEGSFHADTDKFKEVVMEGNFILQELQKEQDWNWLRDKWWIGETKCHPDNRIMEVHLPKSAYKVATGFGDAVRMHHPHMDHVYYEIPYTSPRTGSTQRPVMFDRGARLNMHDGRLQAFVVGDTLTFNRPFTHHENGWALETDIIRYLEPLHICGVDCAQPCNRAYKELVFTEIPDPYYMVVRTAAKRAEGDPSVADRVQSLVDEGSKLLSAMRENDSSKTVPDTYSTAEIGYTRIL